MTVLEYILKLKMSSGWAVCLCVCGENFIVDHRIGIIKNGEFMFSIDILTVHI